MESTFVATKVRIPPQPHRAVQRRRLFNALEQEIPHYKLIHISTPAGYGKTTLLTQWAHTSAFKISWMSINAGDNEQERFLRYMLRAWEVIHPDIRETELGLLLGSMSPNIESVLTAMVNIANDITEHTVFVLDDFHLIEDETIHKALTFLIDHLPPTLHFVLATRAESLLPLARYRARNEMLEIDAKDLQFTLNETTDFLNGLMELDLAQNKVMALQNQFEGWIAGMQLMALTLQRHFTDGDQLFVSGRHRFIADYLSEDVLAPLDPATRQFLLQTSILEQLCGSLCDAVTDTDKGQKMLEFLERENLFLVPLDDRRQWFRYHHLFADFLREELHRRHHDEINDLHQRAAGWYLAHDLPDEAFRHAIKADDMELVIKIAERYVAAKLMGGEVRIVQGWLDAIPEAWHSTYPELGLFDASILLMTGQLEASVHSLNEVEQQIHLRYGDWHWSQARVTALRCYVACFQNDLGRAETLSEQALRDLPEDDVGYRPGIYGALGDTYRRNGYWQQAEESYLKLLNLTHAPAFQFQAVHVNGALADLNLRQGQLRDAENYWYKALAAIEDRENWGSYPLPLTGWVYIRIGELLYERNELTDAWDHLSHGLERAELGGDVRAMIAGYLLAGRLKLTESDEEAATDYLEQARPHLESAQFAHWISRFERFQLELWLSQDRLRTAVEWSDQMLQDATVEQRPESEVAQLAMARVLIIKGDTSSVARALTLLEHLIEMAEEEGRAGVIIEALALQALANWHSGDQADAMIILEQALRLAEPEGYIRLFTDFGLPMARLLQEARSRHVMSDYVYTLLAAFEPEHQPPIQQVLTEPLTPREHDVLELIAAGLTNREIAEKLIISHQTVKKHAGNIYGKLGVRNRTEAASKAREHNLLD